MTMQRMEAGGALCARWRNRVVGEIAGEGSSTRGDGDQRDASSSMRVRPPGSFRANTRDICVRARNRQRGRDNICRDLHACRPVRPLFSYRNAAVCDLPSHAERGPRIREK